MPQSIIEKYGMVESRERLKRHGFHPAVTTKSLEDVLKEWKRVMRRDQKRPTAEEFWSGQQTAKLPITIGFLFKSPNSPSYASRCAAPASDRDSVNALDQMLTHVDTGPLIIDLVLESGRKNLMSLALASHHMWDVVTSQVTIWNSVAGDYMNKKNPNAFICVSPAYTIADILSVRVDYPYGIPDLFENKGSPHPDKWKDRAIKAEGDIMRDIFYYKRSFGCSSITFWNTKKLSDPDESKKPEDFENIQEKVFIAIRALKPFPQMAFSTGFMWEANQFIEFPRHLPFQPTMLDSARRLREMMGEIYQRRNGIRVLQFHKTHLFDRRILAIILRACSNVEMIGVYDCPLIHFGDVVCLLDLIHEINVARRLEHKPEIKSFDFYPYFEKGMPYQHSNAATYGLTWTPNRMEIVQRGFFQIILEAFLKARAMGLDLLFSSHGSFVDFLRRVPNTPFAVIGFLDALHRYVNIDEKSEDDNEKKQAMYDILKPARTALEHVSQDWPDWYIKKMGDYPLFCSSCGYETFQALFPELSKTWGPLDRTCSKCLLRSRMDEESDHFKQEKKMILTRLFKNWKPEVFNKDAPILPQDEDLMRLKSHTADRPAPPGMHTDANGELKIHQGLKPLVRDKKLPLDSLQNLPSLSDLVEGQKAERLWTRMAYVEAHNVDLYSHAIRQLGWDYPENQEEPVETPSFASTRVDSAFPDHPLEFQCPRRTPKDGLPSFDNNAALRASDWTSKFGW